MIPVVSKETQFYVTIILCTLWRTSHVEADAAILFNLIQYKNYVPDL